jgi:hypothetical protein
MRLGQLEALIVTNVVAAISWMIRSGFTSAAAAQEAARQFNYFQDMNEAQLAQAAFELARIYPAIPYWEWMGMLKRFQEYGMISPAPGEPTVTLPPIFTYPAPVKSSLSGSASSIGITLAIIAGGVLLLGLLRR